MHGNRLESVDQNTFEANVNIKSIYFANNYFKYFNPETFAPLTKTCNRCISKRASTPQQLAELKKEMQSKCKSVKNQIANALQDESTNIEKANLKSEIESLRGIVMQFVSNDNHEYCQAHLKLLGKCMLTASQNE